MKRAEEVKRPPLRRGLKKPLLRKVLKKPLRRRRLRMMLQPREELLKKVPSLLRAVRPKQLWLMSRLFPPENEFPRTLF